MLNRIGRGILLVALLLFNACVSTRADSAIDSDTLLTQIEQKQAPLILDTRTRWEYANGHIPGAIQVPFYANWQEIPQLAAYKDKEIVLYCAHGPRANHALKAMREAGFSQVRHLQGDMSLWRRQSKPVETDINNF